MFTLMARVSNPMTPRALFGILNVLTFFPSGALYPTESYPRWLNAISVAFPDALRGARTAESPAQGGGVSVGAAGSGLHGDLRGGDAGVGFGVVQEDAVTIDGDEVVYGR